VSAFLVESLIQATAVWDAQQSHLPMLQDRMLQIQMNMGLSAKTQAAIVTATVIPSTNKNGSILKPFHTVQQLVAAKNRTTHNEDAHEFDDAAGTPNQPPKRYDPSGSHAPIVSPSSPVPIIQPPSELSHVGSSSYHMIDRDAKPLSTTDLLLQRATYSDRENQAILDAIECQYFIIERLDPAPEVFGITVKPTLLRVIGGYVVSAILVVAGKFISG
jgi:hypothetical protein